jgi:hypothetical protein
VLTQTPPGSRTNSLSQSRPQQEAFVAKSVNVLALVREEHRFVFLYDDDSIDTMLATLSQYANDPELDFTWYDAAMMAQRVRKMLETVKQDSKLEGRPYAS